MLECYLNRLQHAAPLRVGELEAVGHHVQHLARPGDGAHLALRLHLGEAAHRQPLPDFFGRGAAGQLHRECDGQTGIVRTHAGLQLGINSLGRVVAHRLRGVAVKQMPDAGKQELQMVVQLGHGAHGGAAGTHRVGLVDGNGRGHALHLVHRWLVHAVQKLSGIGRKSLHVTPLAFGKQRVKHQAGLAGPAGAGHHRELSGSDIQVNVLEIVLTRAANTDKTLRHWRVTFCGSPSF